MEQERMSGSIPVWDIFIRFFHWSLAALIAVVFLSEESYLSVHAAAGYVILFLVAGRVVWGIIGSRHARFADFIHPLATIRRYFADAIRLRHRRTIGHNPVAGAAVLITLSFVAMAGLTGIAAYGAEEGAGPLARLLPVIGWQYGDAVKEIHGFFAWGTLWLAGFHIAAAIFESIHFRENLPLAMITGRKNKQTLERSNNENGNHGAIGPAAACAACGNGPGGSGGRSDG